VAEVSTSAWLRSRAIIVPFSRLPFTPIKGVAQWIACAQVAREHQETMMDTKELVTVYTVGNAVEAEIIRNALQNEGIRAFVEGANQAADAGLVGIPIHIEVAAADADKARKFIAAHEHHHKKKHE
jgi:hypothetical protein